MWCGEGCTELGFADCHELAHRGGVRRFVGGAQRSLERGDGFGVSVGAGQRHAMPVVRFVVLRIDCNRLGAAMEKKRGGVRGRQREGDERMEERVRIANGRVPIFDVDVCLRAVWWKRTKQKR